MLAMKQQTVSEYLRTTYGCKVYKLSLQSGCTCPNRDGTKGTGGCIFCSEGGSGDFAAPFTDIETQIATAKKLVESKFPKNQKERRYIAYFQSFTNTYGDAERLYSLYEKTLADPEVVGISIGTRPDCIPRDILEMLTRLNEIKPVWVELGLQTSSDEVADYIHRGYHLAEFEETYKRLRSRGLTVILHMIVGLPGENREQILDTARYIASLTPAVNGVKIQLLHVLKGTQLADIYEKEPFHILSLEEYVDLVEDILEILPEETIIHRITGDGPKRLLIEPQWSADKKNVLNTLNRRLQKL